MRKVEIVGPHHVRAGEPLSVAVEVTSDESVDVDFIDVHFHGRAGWRFTRHDTTVDVGERVMNEGVLAAGTTTFVARTTIPATTPPTHAYEHGWARLKVTCEVSIPLAPDLRASLDVRVHAPQELESRAPTLTQPAPRASDPRRIDIGLAATRVVPGDVLEGSIASHEIDLTTSRDVELWLTSIVYVPNPAPFRLAERRRVCARTIVTLPAGSSGESIPFQLAIPTEAPPTLAAGTHSIKWCIVAVMVGTATEPGIKTEVPVRIFDVDAKAAPAVAAPIHGTQRIRTLLAELAAAEGWRLDDTVEHDDDLGTIQPSVSRDLESTTLGIGASFRDRTQLAAWLDYRSLGIGLECLPGDALRELFFRDIAVGIAAWDRKHHVDARESAQAVPVLRAVVPVLTEIPSCTLVRWTDEELVFELPAIDETTVAEAARGLARLAATIEQARAAIPPPADVELELDAWRRYAEELHGSLATGDLSIDGSIGPLPVAIHPRWESRQLRSVDVAVGSAETAPPEVREKALQRTLQLGDHSIELRASDGTAVATLPLTRTDGRTAFDIAKIRALVDALHELRGELDVAAGPYR